MGGRGAHDKRENGRIPKSLHTYHSIGIITVPPFGDKVFKVSILEENTPKSQRRDLPAFSNTLYPTFYGVVDDNGVLTRISRYENGRRIYDYDYHSSPNPNDPFLHKHKTVFPTTDELKEWSRNKRKRGSHITHESITQDDIDKFGPLLDLLGRKISTMPSIYRKVN